MGDHVIALSGDRRLPPRIGRRGEVLHGMVEVPDQPRNAGQLSSGIDQRELVWPDHISRHEGQDLTPLIVNAERTRCRAESHFVQVGKEGMHSGSPWSGRTANGVPDANDTLTDVVTGHGLLIIAPHRTSVLSQLAMVTPI